MRLKEIEYRIHDIQNRKGRRVVGYAVDAGPNMPMFCVREVVRGYWSCDDWTTGAGLSSLGCSAKTRKHALERAIPSIRAQWESGEYQKAQKQFARRYL